MNLSRFHIELNSNLVYRLFFFFALTAIILSAADSSFAAATANEPNENDVIGDTLCRLANNLTGGIARGIATMAIFSVGVGLFLGKLNWGVAAATAAGVGIIFSAPKLVAFISADAGDGTCPVNETTGTSGTGGTG